MYLIRMLEIYIMTVSEGTCVLLEIPSMHKLVQYFQSLIYTCRNEDIYELKGVHIIIIIIIMIIIIIIIINVI